MLADIPPSNEAATPSIPMAPAPLIKLPHSTSLNILNPTADTNSDAPKIAITPAPFSIELEPLSNNFAIPINPPKATVPLSMPSHVTSPNVLNPCAANANAPPSIASVPAPLIVLLSPSLPRKSPKALMPLLAAPPSLLNIPPAFSPTLPIRPPALPAMPPAPCDIAVAPVFHPASDPAAGPPALLPNMPPIVEPILPIMPPPPPARAPIPPANITAPSAPVRPMILAVNPTKYPRKLSSAAVNEFIDCMLSVSELPASFSAAFLSGAILPVAISRSRINAFISTADWAYLSL